MTGETAFAKVFGASFYEYLARNSSVGGRFNQVMAHGASVRYADVPTAYDFKAVSKLVDVGSGSGALSAMILKKHPHVHAVLFDSEAVIMGAHDLLVKEQVYDPRNHTKETRIHPKVFCFVSFRVFAVSSLFVDRPLFRS